MQSRKIRIDRALTEEEMIEIHKRGMEEIKAGKGIRVSMETLEEMANERNDVAPSF